MSFLSHIGCVFFVGAGSGIPFAFGAFGERDKWGEFVFTSMGGGISKQPILSCNWKGSSIKVFLDLSSTSTGTNTREGQKIHLKGEGVSQGEPIDFNKRINGAGHTNSGGNYLWNLKVFGSGVTKIESVNGGGSWEEEYDCKTINVFSVITPTYSGTREWEGPIANVKLTLTGCREDSGKRKCDIVIDSEVGLGWNPTFKPKAIFK